MKEGKKDRRIQRTEASLREALVKLIQKKGYAAITVQDILDQANMGRSTFYAHYRDKEDLLLSGAESLMHSFEKEYVPQAGHPVSPEISGREVSLYFFRHADENRAIFQAMIGKPGGEVVERTAQKYLTQMTVKYLSSNFESQSSRAVFDLIIRFMVSSYLAILRWWLDQPAPATAAEINDLFWELVGPGISAVMDGGKGKNHRPG